VNVWATRIAGGTLAPLLPNGIAKVAPTGSGRRLVAVIKVAPSEVTPIEVSITPTKTREKMYRIGGSLSVFLI
jgi:hypothetical protein